MICYNSTSCLDNTSTYALSNNIDGGNIDRFGDQLVQYIKVKWLARIHNIPFVLRSFKYADQLVLCKKERLLDKRSFIQKIRIRDNHIPILFQEKTLYEIDFEYALDPPTNLDDYEQFRNEMRSLIAPIHALKPFDFPAHAISVAVHVRKGSGIDKRLYSRQRYEPVPAQYHFDDIYPYLIQEPNYSLLQTRTKESTYADTYYPFRFPPEQFYIDQIRYLSELLADYPLYVFIFTDAKYPEAIAHIFRSALADKPNITFDHHKYTQSTGQQVLQDLFLMSRFECLIRPASHFSEVAEFIGIHQIILFPRNYEWQDDKLMITEVNVRIND